jgi:hypothetical protein
MQVARDSMRGMLCKAHMWSNVPARIAQTPTQGSPRCGACHVRHQVWPGMC